MRRGERVASQTEVRRTAPWLRMLPVVALVLVIATLFAPIAAVAAIPVMLVLGVHHAIAMARTDGSVVPFAILLGIDILLLIVVIGSLIL